MLDNRTEKAKSLLNMVRESSLQQIRNGNPNSWIEHSRHDYTFDEDGINVTEEIDYYWDKETKEWKYSSRDIFYWSKVTTFYWTVLLVNPFSITVH